MARRGRPALGAQLVDQLESSAVARRRLKLILRTLSGEVTVEDACVALSIRRSMFNKLRARFLADAAGLLEPRQPGPVRRVATPHELEIRRLEQENAQLRLDLKAQEVREQIAVAMPFLLRPRPSRTLPKNPARGREKKSG